MDDDCANLGGELARRQGSLEGPNLLLRFEPHDLPQELSGDGIELLGDEAAAQEDVLTPSIRVFVEIGRGVVAQDLTDELRRKAERFCRMESGRRCK